MRDWIEFLKSPSSVGVSALAILGALYLVRLTLDFVKTAVLPLAYEHRLRRRQIILPFAAKVLDAGWSTPAFFREGDPKLVDFRDGRVFPRPELNTARSLLEKGRFIHLEGPPSSGKTVIALNLAYEWSRAKRTALYFIRPTSVTDTFIDFLATPLASRLLDKKSAIIVVDDVHLDVARSSRLFAFVYTNYSRVSLLFVSRPLSLDNLELDASGYYDFARYMPTVDVRADAIVAPLANFFGVSLFGHAVPPAVLKAFTEECGNDLLLIGRYLREWDGSSTIHLPEIRKQVFLSVRRDLESLRQVSTDAITVLLITSLFYRFEVPVERSFIEGDCKLEVSTLLKRREVVEQNGFLMLHHSSLAKLYANVGLSLRMPEYDALSTTYSPMPAALFRAYIEVQPRNLCELIVGLRRTRDVLPSLLADHSLAGPLRRGLANERDLNLLGWTMLVIYTASRRDGWRVLKDIDLSGLAADVTTAASPEELSLFIFNLARVSRTKGKEWLERVPYSTMARAIEGMSLLHAGKALTRINQFSVTYCDALCEVLDPAAICQLVLQEENLENLKAGVFRLAQVLRDRVCVKVYASEDGFGEWSNRISFYFDSTRVIRFVRGRRLGLPYARSGPRATAYWRRLAKKRRTECFVKVDDGALRALLRRTSLFPVGVKQVVGVFSRGEVIPIVDLTERTVGFGVSNFVSDELRRIMGQRSNEIFARTGIAPNRVMDNDLLLVGPRFVNVEKGG
jgi:PUA domain